MIRFSSNKMLPIPPTHQPSPIGRPLFAPLTTLTPTGCFLVPHPTFLSNMMLPMPRSTVPPTGCFLVLHTQSFSNSMLPIPPTHNALPIRCCLEPHPPIGCSLLHHNLPVMTAISTEHLTLAAAYKSSTLNSSNSSGITLCYVKSSFIE